MYIFFLLGSLRNPPPSLVTVFYVVDRYLGDAVLLAGLYLCFTPSNSKQGCFPRCLRLFQFRAWGTLAYSWATQAIMQLRIYAMYKRSKKVLLILVVSFFSEMAAIAVIIWRAIGPDSPLTVSSELYPDRKPYCAFSGIDGSFTYLFIPVLCFESLLLFLAARVFIQHFRETRESHDTGAKHPRVNSFVRVLARDSLFYFFGNLAMCAVVMGLWQSITALYANICVPFVMLLEVLVGTRLVLNFRERYARGDQGPIVSGRYNSVHHRGENVQMDTFRLSVRYDVETVVVCDTGENKR
ncbi:hypothetical protein F5I97DRAFT_1226507 [Phlebopus sp. FC_14]|nr:hypothetical protein F5I97DRAFT_1226507 [Phlebopus sp. FC_14]